VKIPGSVRLLYESLADDVRLLAEHTNERIRRFTDSNHWFYDFRIKTLESFCLKLETGRVEDPSEMEDLFACSVIVRNQSEVETAAQRLQTELGLTVANRRPESAATTNKYPSSFQFDDLRLYLRHTQPQGLPPRLYLNRVFEVQVKTLLQHAWGLATHDPIYKSQRLSWGRERVGFQTRAILEHVENAIAALDQYEQAISFPQYEQYTRQNAILDFLVARWESARLPSDRRRVASVISDLLRALGLSHADFTSAVDAAATRGEGYAAVNLSPYQAVVMALFDAAPSSFVRLDQGDGKRRIRLLVTPELLEARPKLGTLPGRVVIRLEAA
jgi:ppGpp synthetase/RelA/SpoT-type nucleotidyltranferase